MIFLKTLGFLFWNCWFFLTLVFFFFRKTVGFLKLLVFWNLLVFVKPLGYFFWNLLVFFFETVGFLKLFIFWLCWCFDCVGFLIVLGFNSVGVIIILDYWLCKCIQYTIELWFGWSMCKCIQYTYPNQTHSLPVFSRFIFVFLLVCSLYFYFPPDKLIFFFD